VEKERIQQMETEMREKIAAWASLEAALEKSEAERLEVIQQRDKFRSIYDAGLVKEGPDG
jgi:hypothetical protein